jgi:tRNA(Ile)-lysidine synthase
MVNPELQKINPAFIEAAERTAHRISDTEKLIDYVLDKEQLTSWQGRHLFLDKDKLRFLPGQASLLFRLLSPFGFNYDQVDSILGSIDSVGAIFSSKEATLNIDRQAIIVSPVSTALVPVQITTKTKHFTFNGRHYLCRKISRADFILRKEPFIAAFDFDKLEFPLVMRAYREGERFQPLGMQGKKLISDFLIDEKIPVSLKREQAVIESGGQLAWLVERRIDDRFKVIESTKSIFEISPAGA